MKRLKNKHKVFPLVLVNAQRSDDGKKIFKCEEILRAKITTEPKRKPTRTTQCYRCQVFGHVQMRCTSTFKCFKCACSHLSRECKLAKNATPRCCNCDGLKIINYNANGIRSQVPEFNDFLRRHEIDICCISETHLRRNERISLPGYRIFHTSRTGGARGGTAIVCKANILAAIDTNISNLANTSIITATGGKTTRIVAVYSPPSRNLDFADLEAITKDDTPTIVAGDFNAQHIAWSRSTNTR